MGRSAQSEQSAQSLTGTVKTLIPDKGFGFIRTDDGTEYFFHRDQATAFGQLARGMAVSFIPTQGNKGPRAESVQIA